MDRREFLSWVQGGLAGAAAATLLLRDGKARGDEPQASVPSLCPQGHSRASYLPLRGDEPHRHL